MSLKLRNAIVRHISEPGGKIDKETNGYPPTREMNPIEYIANNSMIMALIMKYGGFMFKRITLFAVALLSFNVFATPTPAELFSTINLRLSYMEDVALYKAIHRKPIEDLEREAVVIEKASLSAEKEGLDKHSVIGFFKAQIAAAKAIQYRYRADLLSQPETGTPRDLKTVIRPELIKLGKQINTDIAHYLHDGGVFSANDLATFKATLNSKYLTDADKKALFDALTQIRLQ
ncbi:chorismate mutase [Vibrio spartinae]|uniref:chorismate mutase n=1 Tax=Vibrio spartinae TaxID=1918945 RepID=A0A1N6M913_9VIBR|nr:chorismate mutase [Vibrio spartinae]SIO95931.1 Monofunctional chorismate mutase precursor [Vibrio spartinae]